MVNVLEIFTFIRLAELSFENKAADGTYQSATRIRRAACFCNFIIESIAVLLHFPQTEQQYTRWSLM